MGLGRGFCRGREGGCLRVGEAPRTMEEWRLGWYDPASGVNALLLNLAAQAIGCFRIRAKAMRGIQSWAGLEGAPASPT